MKRIFVVMMLTSSFVFGQTMPDNANEYGFAPQPSQNLKVNRRPEMGAPG